MPLLRKEHIALLVLEDGSVFKGIAFAGSGETMGEVVFTTGMTGYQEVITDPSYNGQIVTMTYPLIGNYGVNTVDVESWRPHAAGFVIRELSPVVSNWRADCSLAEYLEKNGIPGIQGVTLSCRNLHVSAKNPEHVVGAILDALRHAGVVAQSLNFGTRGLEQLFLTMTAEERVEP